MIILISILFLISLIINIVLVWYVRKILSSVYAAAIAASSIFTRLDTYKSHLKSIYELQMFYGDKNLKEIIDHTNDLIEFLKKYEAVYSFTEPGLEEILKEEDLNENGEEDQKEIQKIFYKNS